MVLAPSVPETEWLTISEPQPVTAALPFTLIASCAIDSNENIEIRNKKNMDCSTLVQYFCMVVFYDAKTVGLLTMLK
ncbi:MAG: hypothetical protein ACJAWV_003199 [Flammeovirgaceae bacterium]|jgi:hypothetical protein